MELRESLEGISVRRACEVLTMDDVDRLRLLLMRQRRAAVEGREDDLIALDEEFHLRIAVASRLPIVTRFLEQLRGFVRVMRLGSARDPGPPARGGRRARGDPGRDRAARRPRSPTLR